MSTFEGKTIDARYRFYGRPTPHTKEIVILDISEEAIKRLAPVYGQWPWPRAVHGEVVEYLTEDGAKAIGFDIIFSEREMGHKIDEKTLNELRVFALNADLPEARSELLKRLNSLTSGASDSGFVSAVEKAGNVFQSSVFYTDKTDLLKNPDLGADKHAVQQISSALSKSSMPLSLRNSRAYFNATVPFFELANVSRGIGHINFFPDKDGTCRRFLPLATFQDRGKAYPSFPLILSSYVKNVPLNKIGATEKGISIGDSALPLFSDGSAYIYYQGGKVLTDRSGKSIYESFYRYIPYDYVLASKDLKEAGLQPLLTRGAFKDKVVLISASAAGLTDLRATPFSPVTPGIEIHANVIDNILSNKFLHKPGRPAENTYVLILAVTIALISRSAGPYRGFFIVATIISFVTGFNWVMFKRGSVLPVMAPVAVMTGTYLGILLQKYISEFREKKYIKSAFGHYIAPAVLEDILRSPDKLRLGGERKYMTVLFSDVEGFTALSERLPPEEISALFNEYLTLMVQCILQTKGTLDKFIGDAVMAVWNAPGEQKDHAARACETALLMMKELVGLRKKWQGENKPPLYSRIGINTGEMIVGNMGSREIFDYTVLGSEVNTAARLEPLNKDFGTRIAVSQSTCMEAKKYYPERFLFRRLAPVVLKGRNTPLEVYELVGFQDGLDGKIFDMVNKFETGLDLFMKARFSEAREHFLKALEINPEDKPSTVYTSLCAYYEKTPPPAGWDGAYIQQSK